jgi:phosphate transport system protein
MEAIASFEGRLQQVVQDVVSMGDLVEKAIYRSVEALKKRDLKLAHQIIAEDTRIDKERFRIEDSCSELIATRQLSASDLRTIVAILNIITELERIGDYAE